jgi:hypothetical protein
MGLNSPKRLNKLKRLAKSLVQPFRMICSKRRRKCECYLDILGYGVMPSPDHQYICCHMNFDVKMENFLHKAWLIARGHATKA